MATKKNTPFSVFKAAEDLKKHKSDLESSGSSSMPNYTQKATPQPSKPASGGAYGDAAKALATIGKAMVGQTAKVAKAKAKSMNKKK